MNNYSHFCITHDDIIIKHAYIGSLEYVIIWYISIITQTCTIPKTWHRMKKIMPSSVGHIKRFICALLKFVYIFFQGQMLYRTNISDILTYARCIIKWGYIASLQYMIWFKLVNIVLSFHKTCIHRQMILRRIVGLRGEP